MEITRIWYNGANGIPLDAKNIRITVFMEEQGFENEFDEWDNQSEHLVLYSQGIAVATARIFPDHNGKIYHIGRVAVLKSFRKNSLGSTLVTLACERIRQLGGQVATLSAQSSAIAFYKTLGFVTVGEPYLDEGCPHICMNKNLLPCGESPAK